MTTLLSEVLRKVAELPQERQDDAARVLLSLLENDMSQYELSETQRHDVERAITDVDTGRFASDRDIVEVLHRPWA